MKFFFIQRFRHSPPISCSILNTSPRFIPSSDCSATISLVHISAVVAVDLRGLYSFASTFSFFLLLFLNLLGGFPISKRSSSECKYRIDRSMSDFGVCSLRPHLKSSLPLNNSSTIVMFHFPLFFSSSLIKTTTHTSIFISFVLCILLHLSWRDCEYSFSHLFHAASLHLLM